MTALKNLALIARAPFDENLPPLEEVHDGSGIIQEADRAEGWFLVSPLGLRPNPDTGQRPVLFARITDKSRLQPRKFGAGVKATMIDLHRVDTVAIETDGRFVLMAAVGETLNPGWVRNDMIEGR